MSYIRDKDDRVKKTQEFVAAVLRKNGIPTLTERILGMINAKSEDYPQTLEEAKEEAYRYLVIMQDGQPRVGPDTLAEWIQKTIKADAYIESFQSIIYERKS